MIMYTQKEDPYLWGKKIFAIVMVAVLSFGLLGTAVIGIRGIRTSSDLIEGSQANLNTVSQNSLLAISGPSDPIRTQKIKVVITAYSSTVCQTDDTPFITASGKNVEDGIIANNMLPFGTFVKIPEIYGDKMFIVEDRMHSRKGYYHVDVWFEDYYQAKEFGAKTTYIEVLES